MAVPGEPGFAFYSEMFGYPTREELDDVHRVVTELRREVRKLQRASRDVQKKEMDPSSIAVVPLAIHWRPVWTRQVTPLLAPILVLVGVLALRAVVIFSAQA